MMLSFAFLNLVLVVGASSLIQAPLQSKQVEGPNLPGKNPFNYCEPTANYLVDIDFVDLDPNPPKPGQQLTVKAGGTIRKQIEFGSTVHITIKMGPWVKILDQTLDLCEKLGEVELECPVQKGYLNITKVVDIPREVPPAKFDVTANATTANEKEIITCLVGSVDFRG